jgi:hypothetical protein
MEIKFWIDVENFELNEAFSFNFAPAAKREIKKIIYEHLEYIVSEWNRCFEIL